MDTKCIHLGDGPVVGENLFGMDLVSKRQLKRGRRTHHRGVGCLCSPRAVRAAASTIPVPRLTTSSTAATSSADYLRRETLEEMEMIRLGVERASGAVFFSAHSHEVLAGSPPHLTLRPGPHLTTSEPRFFFLSLRQALKLCYRLTVACQHAS